MLAMIISKRYLLWGTVLVIAFYNFTAAVHVNNCHVGLEKCLHAAYT